MVRTMASPRYYTMDAMLAEGFTYWQVRKYIRDRVLSPAASGRGRHAVYPEDNIAVLRELKRRREQQSTLADLREWRLTRHRSA